MFKVPSSKQRDLSDRVHAEFSAYRMVKCPEFFSITAAKPEQERALVWCSRRQLSLILDSPTDDGTEPYPRQVFGGLNSLGHKTRRLQEHDSVIGCHPHVLRTCYLDMHRNTLGVFIPVDAPELQLAFTLCPLTKPLHYLFLTKIQF